VIALADAQAHVLARCAVRPPASHPIGDALGAVLAEDVIATEPVPPFDNSAVDGFAVRAIDTSGGGGDRPVRLRVVATLAAGAALDRPLGQGEAVRIMTGAPIPPGADAVVMVERSTTVRDDDGAEAVDLYEATVPGRHLRRVGDDIAAGSEVLSEGTVLAPAHLGVAASVGRRQLTIVPPLRVGVLSTGDELVEADRPLRPGEIRESNRPMLLAMVRQAGCQPVDLGLVADDEAVLADVLARGAAQCDALVSSGGVSMGDFDVVKTVLDRLADMAWMQIAIKPAKPFAFGLVDGTPVFGLPGNPVSSLVSFELLARPALRKMMGHRTLDRPLLAARAGVDLRRQPDGKAHYLRVTAEVSGDGRIEVIPVLAQGSHQLAATAGANALAVLADGDGVAAGEPVQTMLIGELGP